ncbi:MAG: OmpA family protein [Acidimicrobiales bacterium]|nr:OmpA family protein [Acidimicrobiales bacterium]
MTVWIDAFSAPLTRLGLLSLLAIFVLGLSILAVPGLLSDDEPNSGDTVGLSGDAEVSTTAASEPESISADEDQPDGVLLATARVSADGIVLDGLVTTEGQRDALVDSARRRVGPALVEDNLEVATGLTSSVGRDNGVVALQSFLAGVPDGVTIAATSADGRFEVVGEAVDDATSTQLQELLATVAAASPGVDTVNDVIVPPPPPPTQEELAAAAQFDLDQLNALLLEEVLFATGKNEPTEEFKALLDQLPELMDRHPAVRIEVAGHTDDRGSEGGNQELSEQRAAAAVAYLVEIGAPAERLSSRGAGESEPIDTNTTRDGRARNRRVELTAF